MIYGWKDIPSLMSIDIDTSTIVKDTLSSDNYKPNQSGITTIVNDTVCTPNDRDITNELRCIENFVNIETEIICKPNDRDITNELRCLENCVNIETVKIKSDDIRIEMLKTIVVELQEQVFTLKEDLKFLKEEIKQKNNVINFFTFQEVSVPEKEKAINSNAANNSSLFLQQMVDENKSKKYKDVAYSPNFEHVTIRKKYNPADGNMCNSFNGELQLSSTFVADPLHSGDSNREAEINETVVLERRRAKITEMLDVVRKEKQIEFKKHKASSINPTNEDLKKKKLGAWEQYTKGFASRVMKKMGYGGGGLGKREDGIIDPIMPSSVNKDLNSPSLGGPVNLNSKVRNVDNYVKPWPKGTTLITGDSILCGIDENRLNNAKVRVFIGACVDDMYDFLTPLLKKKPTNIILHIGSNDSPYKDSERIVEEIVKLRENILSILPTVKIYISCPTIRFDNSKADSVLREVEEMLKCLFKDVILNDNVNRDCVGKKGLHLNPKGSGRLATNFISLMRRL